MKRGNFDKIIDYIVRQGVAALKQYTSESDFVLDYVAVFSKSEDEYNELKSVAETLGKEIDQESAKTGNTFLLQQPYYMPAGLLKVIKVRKPDPTRPQRGGPDFKVKDYQKFKKKYLGSSGNFTLMPRKDYEMIELKGVDVLVYIPSRTVGERLNENFQ